MDSAFLTQRGFKKLDTFRRLSTADLNKYKTILTKTGVYIFAAERKFNRLNGKTDILYIGQSGGARHGKQRVAYLRMRDYFIGSESAPQDNRIHNTLEGLLRQNKKIVLLFKGVNAKKCKAYEGELLKKFGKEHLELPPLNRQG